MINRRERRKKKQLTVEKVTTGYGYIQFDEAGVTPVEQQRSWIIVKKKKKVSLNKAAAFNINKAGNKKLLNSRCAPLIDILFL